MAMTMTQKILAKHAGLDHVEAGQLIEAKLDVVMANDIIAQLPILPKEDHILLLIAIIVTIFMIQYC